MTPTDPAAVEAMIERLLAEAVQPYPYILRNPNGPEAAAMLRALASGMDDLHDKVGKLSRDNTTLADIADNAEAEAAALREALRDEIVMAYEQGALDVHLNWQEDRDPDFSEAASDYAASRAALKENYDGL